MRERRGAVIGLGLKRQANQAGNPVDSGAAGDGWLDDWSSLSPFAVHIDGKQEVSMLPRERFPRIFTNHR